MVFSSQFVSEGSYKWLLMRYVRETKGLPNLFAVALSENQSVSYTNHLPLPREGNILTLLLLPFPCRHKILISIQVWCD